MNDMDEARAALEHLAKNIDDSENDISQMEVAVGKHNRKMIRDGAQLRTEIKGLREQVDDMRDDMEDYKQRLLSFVTAFKQAVHKEQIETLNKHMDNLNFEKALLRSQIKEMIRKEL
jgi:chromosome segregation ATPase